VQSALDAAVSGLNDRVQQADEPSKSLPDNALSSQDIERVESQARDPQSCNQLRELQRRVDKRELSWREIISGQHWDDPGVQAALATTTPALRRGYELIAEGASEREILQANPANVSSPGSQHSSLSEWESSGRASFSTNKPLDFLVEDEEPR
jgi:hypothetical protein